MKSLKLINKIFNKEDEIILKRLTILIGDNATGKSEVIRELKNKESFKVLNTTRGRFYELTPESQPIIRKIFNIDEKNNIFEQSNSAGINLSIPIILELSNISRNKVAIEHPELGLSEKYIHRLTNYIVERLNNKNSIVLETHSLQVMDAITINIIEGNINSEDVIINLLYKESKDSKTSIKSYKLKDSWKGDIPTKYFPFNHTYNDALKIALEKY